MAPAEPEAMAAAARGVCVITEMDDGLNRATQLWKTQGVAVRLPSELRDELGTDETVVVGIRETMVHGFAAKRCLAVFSVPPPKPVAVEEKKSTDSTTTASSVDELMDRLKASRPAARCIRVRPKDLFYASPETEKGALSVASLSEPPPCALEIPTRPVERGERLVIAQAPEAAMRIDNLDAIMNGGTKLLPSGPDGRPRFALAKVRAVSHDRFWYDVDPAYHREHKLHASKGCALYRVQGLEFVGLRLGNPEENDDAVGPWTHVAVAAVAVVSQLWQFVDDQRAALARQQEVNVSADEKITSGGLRVVRSKLRNELQAYRRRRPCRPEGTLPFEVQNFDGAAKFAAEVAGQYGIDGVLSLAIDFARAHEIDGATEMMYQAAVLCSKSFDAAIAATKSDQFLATMLLAARGEKTTTKCQEQQHFAAAGCECIAAIARRVDAEGLARLLEAPESVVASLRLLKAVAKEEGSLARVATWLQAALRAAAALTRGTAHCRRFDCVDLLDDLLDDIRALTRRGRALASGAADALALWNHVHGRLTERRSKNVVVPTTGLSDAQIAYRTPSDWLHRRIHDDTITRPPPHLGDPALLADDRRAKVSSNLIQELRNPENLPADEIPGVIHDYMTNLHDDDISPVESPCLLPGLFSTEDLHHVDDDEEDPATVCQQHHHDRILCPEIASPNLRKKIFSNLRYV